MSKDEMRKTKKPLGRRSGRWLDDYGWVASQPLFAAGMAMGGMVTQAAGWPEDSWSNWRWTWLLGGLVAFLGFLTLTVVAAVKVWGLGPKLEAQEQEVEQLRDLMQTQPVRLLRTWAKDKLGFAVNAENTERVTLYLYRADTDPAAAGVFVRLARYSSNPAFEAGGRSSYPADEGCIAKARQNGWFFCNDLPDPASDPKGYADRQKQYGLTQAETKALRMKSRLYAGRAIREDGQVVAVLLVESTEEDRWTQQEVKDAIGETEQATICEWLAALGPRLPDPQDAKEAGF